MVGVFDWSNVFFMRNHNLSMVSVLLFAFLFSGCNARVELGDVTPEVEYEELVDVSFSAGFDDLSTRVYPTGKFEVAKHRVTFNDLRFVFYHVDPDTHRATTVAYLFDKNVSAQKGVFSGVDLQADTSDASADTLSFEVKGTESIAIDDYHLYVFASPNKAIKEVTEVGKDFSLLLDPLLFDPENDFDKYYLNHSLYFNETPIVIKREDLKQVAPGAKMNIPAARLSSLNALLSVEWKKSMKDPEYEIIGENLFFYTDVQNRSFKLFAENDPVLAGAGLDLYYPMDGNYQGLSGAEQSVLESHFFYTDFTREGRSIAIHMSSLNPSRKDSYRAVPENTLAASDAFGNLATRVVFRVNVIPTSIKSKFKESDISNGNVTWVWYDSKCYAYGDFVRLYNSIVAKGNAQTEAEKAMISEASNFVKPSDFTSPKINYGFDGEVVKLYYKGETFYATPITHFTEGQLGGNRNLPGRFGVVRNNHYRLVINSFATIGKAATSALPRSVNYNSPQGFLSSVSIADMNEIETIIEELY